MKKDLIWLVAALSLAGCGLSLDNGSSKANPSGTSTSGGASSSEQVTQAKNQVTQVINQATSSSGSSNQSIVQQCAQTAMSNFVSCLKSDGITPPPTPSPGSTPPPAPSPGSTPPPMPSGSPPPQSGNGSGQGSAILGCVQSSISSFDACLEENGITPPPTPAPGSTPPPLPSASPTPTPTT